MICCGKGWTILFLCTWMISSFLFARMRNNMWSLWSLSNLRNGSFTSRLSPSWDSSCFPGIIQRLVLLQTCLLPLIVNSNSLLETKALPVNTGSPLHLFLLDPRLHCQYWCFRCGSGVDSTTTSFLCQKVVSGWEELWRGQPDVAGREFRASYRTT